MMVLVCQGPEIFSIGGDEIELGPQSLTDAGVLVPLEVAKRDFRIARDALVNTCAILGVQSNGLSRTIRTYLPFPPRPVFWLEVLRGDFLASCLGVSFFSPSS